MERNSNEILKIVLNYRLLDDDFFKEVADDIPTCQEILRTLLEDKSLVVIDAKTQVTEVGLKREIRLDAKCILGNGSICNIEVQKGNKNDDIRRTRFHTSILTANNTQKGTEFEEVPDVIVIYISEYDVLKNGQRITQVKRCQMCGNKYVPIDDGELIIFANTVFSEDELKNKEKMSEVDHLLMLFNRKDVFYDEKFPNISNRVRYFKEEKEDNVMCTAVEEYGKRCAKEGKILAYFDMGLTIEEIADKLSIDANLVKDIVKDVSLIQ